MLIVFLKKLIKRMKHPRLNRAASALAFTSILSLVPMIVLIFNAVSIYNNFDKWLEVSKELIYANFIPATGEIISKYLDRFIVNADKLTLNSTIFLLLSVVILFSTIETSLNDIWSIKKGRPYLERIIICATIIFIGPLLILSSLSISSHIVSISYLPKILIPIFLKTKLIEVLPYLFELVTFFLIFFIIPNQKVFVRYALLGALVSTILFEVSKHTFTIYILKYNSYQIIYHALWTIPAFFVWIYISWLVVLIGACVTAELSTQQTIK